MKPIKFLLTMLVFTFILQTIPLWAANRGLDNETNGVFAGISQNFFDFSIDNNVQGTGWIAGIIQKTEKRAYGYLTGLLYFDYIKINGDLPEMPNSEIIINDIVFSLWLTQLFRKNSFIAPAISLGPAFIIGVKTSIENDTQQYSYSQAIFDLKAQLSLGAYINIQKDLYIYPNFIFSYNLLNNNKLAEEWKLNKEYNIIFSLGLLYTVNY